MENLEIRYLCDDIQHAHTSAGWIYNEFIKGIKHGVTFEDVLERTKNCSRDTLPVRLVALLSQQCAGTVSLVENDLKSRPYTPWLASLYVDRTLRSRGIGRALIERVKDIARDMGYEELYLRTEHAADYYRGLGWQYVETCQDDYGLVPEVFKWKL